MMNLWSTNTPQAFWRCLAEFPAAVWDQAIAESAPILGLGNDVHDIETILSKVLGEGQFGAAHWQLGPAKRLYYQVKPWIPRRVTRVLRRWYGGARHGSFPLRWPVEDRYARFQWAVMQRVMTLTDQTEVPFIHFWPGGCRCALVLTHDIETARGQANVRRVAELETRLGFRSSFTFVAERYRLDDGLMQELRSRGFEIGVHGLKHDGRLFASHEEFMRRAVRINDYVRRFGACGFRSPLTHRQPEWMQSLDVEYDLSFFDTDPYEPIPGGTMSVWPFRMGHLMELPYTLPQDYTLAAILGERYPSLWLEKVAFLESFHGMILVNAHPDYMLADDTFRLYADFLQDLRQREAYWHALPREVARWWRERMDAAAPTMPAGATPGTLRQTNGRLDIT
jgi:hypothetical protein